MTVEAKYTAVMNTAFRYVAVIYMAANQTGVTYFEHVPCYLEHRSLIHSLLNNSENAAIYAAVK